MFFFPYEDDRGKGGPMGFMRHKSENTIEVDRTLGQVFSALEVAGKRAGTLKKANRSMGYLVIRVGMSLIPLRNPATVRATLKSVDGDKTMVSFESDSFDGIIGLGSAGKGLLTVSSTPCLRKSDECSKVRPQQRFATGICDPTAGRHSMEEKGCLVGLGLAYVLPGWQKSD